MNAIVVDDEQLALEEFQAMLSTSKRIERYDGFTTAKQALVFLQDHQVSIAFLDIELHGMNGLMLATRIKEIQPSCRIVFVSGYAHHAVEAFKIRPMNYLMKPVSREDIEEELTYLEHTLQQHELMPVCYIQCFGNFEMFVNGVPAKFRYSKTRELLAVLIDRRGKTCSMSELAMILWEDKPETLTVQSQLRNLFVDLKAVLKEAGLSHVLLKKRNQALIDVVELPCDYIQFLHGELAGINAYLGEYMSQYSWAEMTNSVLWKKDC